MIFVLDIALLCAAHYHVKLDLPGCHENHRHEETQRRICQEKHSPRSSAAQEGQPPQHSATLRDSQTAIFLLHRNRIRCRRRTSELSTKPIRLEIERITSETHYEATDFGALPYARARNCPSVRNSLRVPIGAQSRSALYNKLISKVYREKTKPKKS